METSTYQSQCEGTSEVSQIYLGRSVLPVSVTSVWLGLSAKNFYKAPLSGGSRNEIKRYKDDYIPRRYSGSGQIQGPADRQSDSSGQAIRALGVCAESEEVCMVTYTNHRVPRVHGQFFNNDNPPPSGQDDEDREGMQACVSQTQSDRARQLAHLIGLLSSSTLAIAPAPFHYRALQRLRNKALQQGRKDPQEWTRNR